MTTELAAAAAGIEAKPNVGSDKPKVGMSELDLMQKAYEIAESTYRQTDRECANNIMNLAKAYKGEV
jgi:hypothetical protein